MTGETENGRSISVIKQVLAHELEFRNRPGGGQAEERAHRHRDRRGKARQIDGVQGVRRDHGREVGFHAVFQRLAEDQQQRHEQEQGEKDQRHSR